MKQIKKRLRASGLCLILSLAAMLATGYVEAIPEEANQGNSRETREELAQSISASQEKIALLEGELLKQQEAAADMKKAYEEVAARLTALEQGGQILTPEYSSTSAEAQRLRADYENTVLDATKIEGAKAEAVAQANGVRAELIQEMKEQIAVAVEQFKQEAAVAAAQAEQKEVVAQQAEAAQPVPAADTATLADSGLSEETLRLRAAAEQAKVDAQVAVEQAQAAEIKFNELSAEYENTKQEIARAEEQQVAVEQKQEQLVASVEVAEAAAKQAELQAAAAAPVVPAVVAAVNLPQGFGLDGTGLKQVSIGANNGKIEVWGVSSTGMLMRWNSQLPAGSRMETFNAVDVAGVPLAGFTNVSLADDGTFMALSGGRVYRFNWMSNQFTPEAMPTNISFDRISVGSNEDIWAVDSTNQKIYQLTANGWEEEFDGRLVAAAADGTVLALNSQGVAFRRVMKAVTSDGSVTAAAGLPASQRGIRAVQAEETKKTRKEKRSKVGKKQRKNKQNKKEKSAKKNKKSKKDNVDKKGKKNRRGRRTALSDGQENNNQETDTQAARKGKKGRKGKAERKNRGGKKGRRKGAQGNESLVSPGAMRIASTEAGVMHTASQGASEQADAEFTWNVVDSKQRMKLSDIAVVNGGLIYGISFDGANFVQLSEGSDQWSPVQAADGSPAAGLVSLAGNSAGVVVAVDGSGNMIFRGDLFAAAPQVSVASQAIGQQETVAAVQQVIPQQDLAAGSVAVAGARRAATAGQEKKGRKGRKERKAARKEKRASKSPQDKASRQGKRAKGGKRQQAGKKTRKGKAGKQSSAGQKSAKSAKKAQKTKKSKKSKKTQKTKKGAKKKRSARQ